MKMRSLIALPLLALTATAAFAQDGATCRNGLFPDEKTFATAVIGGKGRAYFHDDTDGCPSAGGNCRTQAYLTPGDKVVFSRIRNGFACVYFPDAQGGTAGWVDMKHLLLQPLRANPPKEAWLGRWNSAGNPSLEFSKDLGALKVDGEAYWPGRPGTHDWPSTHEGTIAGRVDVSGHKASYRDENLCEIRFTLLGDFLVASDNRKCGGANVSFSAVYQRSEN